MSILETESLCKHFGALAAVHNVSLMLREKELTSIIGPNGAGKTTLYNLLTGKLKPTQGRVIYRGKDITPLSPHSRAQLGMSRTFQITNIFLNMRVIDNIRVARIIRAGKSNRLFRAAKKDLVITEDCQRILKMVGLEEQHYILCSQLSHGDRRLVEIALALATEPDLLFLDEPTAGMNPKETQQIVNIIRGLFEKEGVNFVITEHDMDVVFSVSDRIIVLNQGTILADGRPSEIRENEKVIEAYLGKGSGK